jgi:hypothetical protein
LGWGASTSVRSTETVSADRQRLLSSFNESFLAGRRDRFE